MNPQLNRKLTALILGLATAGTALLWMRRHNTSLAENGSAPPSRDRVIVDKYILTHPEIERQKTHPKPAGRKPKERKKRTLLGGLSVGISLLLTIAAFFELYVGYSVLPALCLLSGMTISAIILRGPTRSNGWAITLGGLILFVIQCFAATVYTLRFEDSQDVLTLLEVTLFGIAFFGILLSLIASWLRKWKFTEPVCLGLVGVALGALCIPGLESSSQEASPPQVTGSALLFATGSSGQKISLGIETADMGSTSQWESFNISNLSKQPIHWALFLDGGASVKDNLGPHLELSDTDMAWGPSLGENPADLSAPKELFYGYLKAGGSALLGGDAHDNFSDSAGDEIAVTLPSYGQGGSADGFFSASGTKKLVKVLGSLPVSREGDNFTAQIDSGPVSEYDSLMWENYTSTNDPSSPDELEWITHWVDTIRYLVKDSQATHTIDNLMFAFAVLLGVAGAAILAGLQSAIHVSSSTEDSADD